MAYIIWVLVSLLNFYVKQTICDGGTKMWLKIEFSIVTK